jgi:ABC-type amino acid transport substrate-binding protein
LSWNNYFADNRKKASIVVGTLSVGEFLDQEDPTTKKRTQESDKAEGWTNSQLWDLYEFNKFILDVRTFFSGGESQQAFAAVKVIRFGKLTVAAENFHRVIKPAILKAVGKDFQIMVGKNPDILIKGENIFLTGAKNSGFYGKTIETGLKVKDFIK